jgi:hypothetical protein
MLAVDQQPVIARGGGSFGQVGSAMDSHSPIWGWRGDGGLEGVVCGHAFLGLTIHGVDGATAMQEDWVHSR